MHPRAGVADLRAGDQRRTVVEPGRARRTAGALGDVLVNFAIFVRAGTEAFHRRVNDPRIESLNRFPGKPLPVQRAGREVFHENVTTPNQFAENFFALLRFGVERDAPLVAVEHGEIEAVDIRFVAQLTARDVAAAGQFDFDHVRAEPRQQLRASRPGLHMGHIENANSIERFSHRLLFSLRKFNLTTKITKDTKGSYY